MKIRIETSSGPRIANNEATLDEVCAFCEQSFMAGWMAWFKVFADEVLYCEMESSAD